MKTTLSEALRALTETKESENQQRAFKRSKAAQVREVYPDIEAAQQAGISLAEIADTLSKQGLDINRKTLETVLYRIRHPSPKKRKGAAAPGNQATSQPAPQNTSVKRPLDAKALLGDLAGKPKSGEFSPIPKHFEIDESEKGKK